MPVRLLVLLGLLGLPLRASAESGFVEMPVSADGTWVLASPPGSNRTWGRPETIRHLVLVAEEWRRRHPDGPRLRIGDISKSEGEPFPPHKTHTDGCAIDIFTSPKNVCHVTYEDQEVTAELARLFIDLGARQILYNHPRVQQVDPRIVMEWPLHDDHFHVVVDPARVPAEGRTLVLAVGPTDGGYLGSDGYRDGRLALVWRVVPESEARRRAVIEVKDESERVLLETPPASDLAHRFEAPLALENGASYSWRVRLVSQDSEGEIASAWTRFTIDLDPPEIELLAPPDGAEVASNPELSWKTTDPGGGSQAWFEVELSTDKQQKKGVSLGRNAGATATLLVPGPLKARRTVFWRVRVSDGRGNEAVSAWRSFRTARDYRYRPPRARVTADTLNLRGGPGTTHGVVAEFSKGQDLVVLEERGDWLRVTATLDGQLREGWVHRAYVERVAD